MVQLFKGDELELKFDQVGQLSTLPVALSLDQFFDAIYSSPQLGAFLYDENRVPLANAIKREVFISSFKEIFEAFAFCGTFEKYIELFKKIFGDDCQIEFFMQGHSGLGEFGFVDADGDHIVDYDGTPLVFGEDFAAGILKIYVDTSSISEFPAVIREIDDDYVIYNLIDNNGDQIAYSGILGIENESELEAVVFVLAPSGIYTEVTLNIS